MKPSQRLSKNSPNYGKGLVEIDDPSGAFLEDQLSAKLSAEIESDRWRPPTLPRVALEIFQLCQQRDCSVDEIVATLEQDPMIAGRVLKVAQSSAYAGSTRMTSVRQAIVRIGLDGIRDIVMQVSLETKIFRHPVLGSHLEDIWAHSQRVAQLARTVARLTPFESELAFLSGLLHDIGIAGALLLAAELKVDEDAPISAVLGASFSLHEKVGMKLATRWGLPPEVAFAIRAHHSLYDAGHMNPHAAILIVAESLDETAHSVDSTTPPKIALEATQLLGLSDSAVMRLVEQAKGLSANAAA